jgi:hypothetical protein
MTKTNRYYYDKMRDLYTLVVENEEKRNKPAAPIKKKKPTFEKSTYIKYGSGYADQGSGGSKIRTTYKDWDENYKPQKSLKEFIEDSGYKKEKVSKKDVELEGFMHQCFLAAKSIDDFRLWIEFVNHLS